MRIVGISRECITLSVKELTRKRDRAELGGFYILLNDIFASPGMYNKNIELAVAAKVSNCIKPSLQHSLSLQFDNVIRISGSTIDSRERRTRKFGDWADHATASCYRISEEFFKELYMAKIIKFVE